ncbi:hypothetical protein OVA24_08140 [Luteolibacter sp. SL250]|uniref:hypothetical protein n=1 Tax=Luteolibacter sp. SL250 TaxID=2995170 RepID=UPI00226E790B|nr:hypothetical protein [Luteolibacter sp. SL250]WAC21354.1 hypothetical protein OVA24_08140 [Luteolibacter sp. SL250]
MKPSISKLTHAGAAVFGLLLAFALLHRQEAHSGTAATDVPSGKPTRPGHRHGNGGSAEMKAATAARHAAPQKFRAGEYQKAWDAIADQSLPAQQRFYLQMELLRQWAEVDLEGALIAAFDTSWDGRNQGMGIQGLLQAFDQEFARRPTESWDIITSGRFGLGAALAKGKWAQSVVKENPLLVANHLRQIPYHTRRSLFPQVLAAIKEDPSKIGAFYDKLTELPQDNLFRDMVRDSIRELGARGSTDEIRSKFLESTSDAQRTILVHEFGKSLANSSADTIQAELTKLPEADRGRMLRSLAHHAETGGEHSPQLIAMIVKAGEYKEVVQQVNEHIRTYASTPEKQASLAAWAVNLPQMPDAAAVIHRSVSYYAMNDPQGARAWLDSVPASTWGRNTALAEYSQQMLWKHNNPEESAWALSQINDPKLKETATGWRGSWEKKNRKQ